MTAPGGGPAPADDLQRDGPSHSAAVAALLAGAAALGGFLFGYDSSVINGTVDALKDQFGLGGFAVGFVVSAALLGCAAGAWFAGPQRPDRPGAGVAHRVRAVRDQLARLGAGLQRRRPDLLAAGRPFEPLRCTVSSVGSLGLS
ncbi:hypothetical protein [Spirillospora sp. CA-128828]|uniref:hypothetical protein n=1 Tax=Spirillospora sp. CA-128828 TaxID=3240033 RepID=UPI003D91A8FE